MRDGFRTFRGKRINVEMEFVCISSKGYVYDKDNDATILFKNIKDFNGNILSDHVWFDYGKRFKILGKLNKGDIIYCNGKVTKYKRSNNSIDFSLSNLKRIRRNKSSEK